MTAAEALKFYGSRLTEFERAEIEKYSEIWYLGLSATKIRGEEGAAQNGGYDDENGSYNKVFHDHISYRWVFPFYFIYLSPLPLFLRNFHFNSLTFEWTFYSRVDFTVSYYPRVSTAVKSNKRFNRLRILFVD